MITEKDMTLKSGMLAYFDSLRGVMPCRVLSIKGGNTPGKPELTTSNIRVKVEFTAPRPGYRRGDTIESSALWVVPRRAVTFRKYGTKIWGPTYIISDTPV